MKECNKQKAEITFMSTAPGASFLALMLGFSLGGSLILGCAIGYYFYKEEE